MYRSFPKQFIRTQSMMSLMNEIMLKKVKFTTNQVNKINIGFISIQGSVSQIPAN